MPDVAAGGTASLTYTAHVNAGARGATLRNSAAPATAGGTCAASCTTTAHTPSWSLAKTSTPGDGATVIPGDVISYTLTATNTSAAVISGATAVDDLSQVTDDADVTATAAGLSLDGQTLTWAIPTLQPGAHAAVTYTALVRADGATITNTVVPVGAGGSCTACTTTQFTGCLVAGEVVHPCQRRDRGARRRPRLHPDRRQHRARAADRRNRDRRRLRPRRRRHPQHPAGSDHAVQATNSPGWCPPCPSAAPPR